MESLSKDFWGSIVSSLTLSYGLLKGSKPKATVQNIIARIEKGSDSDRARAFYALDSSWKPYRKSTDLWNEYVEENGLENWPDWLIDILAHADAEEWLSPQDVYFREDDDVFFYDGALRLVAHDKEGYVWMHILHYSQSLIPTETAGDVLKGLAVHYKFIKEEDVCGK